MRFSTTRSCGVTLYSRWNRSFAVRRISRLILVLDVTRGSGYFGVAQLVGRDETLFAHKWMQPTAARKRFSVLVQRAARSEYRACSPLNNALTRFMVQGSPPYGGNGA